MKTVPKIAIDLRMWGKSGIGVYCRHIVTGVIQKWQEPIWLLLGNKEKLLKDLGPDHSHKQTISYEAPIYSIREQLNALRLPDCDLLWVPHFNVPIAYRGRLVVTIHDVFHLAIQEMMGSWAKARYARFLYQQASQLSKLIITVSQFSKSEIIKHLQVAPRKIHVIQHGVAPEYFEHTLESHQNSAPYFLYVGNFKPHKNLKTLVEAFKKVAHSVPHSLRIVGKKEGFITEDKETLAFITPEIESRIIFLSEIKNEDLVREYRGAFALIHPSLYEGFGLPPLEAMACGVPVISSNAASLPEVCGQAAWYFNPKSPDELAGLMLRLIRDSDARNQLISLGRDRARRYSWDKACEEHIEILKRLIINVGS